MRQSNNRNISMFFILMCFNIHPCVPAVVIQQLIRPCDTDVCITHLITHRDSLCCYMAFKHMSRWVKLPSCITKFTSWFPENTRPTDKFWEPAGKPYDTRI